MPRHDDHGRRVRGRDHHRGTVRILHSARWVPVSLPDRAEPDYCRTSIPFGWLIAAGDYVPRKERSDIYADLGAEVKSTSLASPMPSPHSERPYTSGSPNEFKPPVSPPHSKSSVGPGHHCDWAAFDPAGFGDSPDAPPVPTTICWDDLDPVSYTVTFQELSDWLAWFRQTYRIPATVFPNCWFTHPGIREDLGHLWTGWLVTRHPTLGWA